MMTRSIYKGTKSSSFICILSSKAQISQVFCRSFVPNLRPRKPRVESKTKMMERVVLLLDPFFGMGHLGPMLQLANLFVRHGFAVTIVVVNLNSGDTAASISRFSAANPSISFHHLPPISFSADHNAQISTNFFHSMRRKNPTFRDFLTTLSSVRAVVLDFFCSDALDVTTELRLPSYFMFSSSVADLAVFLYLPKLLSGCSLKDSGDAPLDIPGLIPIRASDLPDSVMDPENEDVKGIMYHFSRLPDSDGILVNSFEWLEPRPLKEIRSGVFVPGRSMPAVYCIGPLNSEAPKPADGKHECVAWLDEQPRGSVVFLCFGTWGTFSGEQIKEIAMGLERSEQSFLWVVKAPKKEGQFRTMEKPEEPDLEKLLPEGFMDRTAERGLVVKSWAPQVEVLRHEAVGAFVSHCGWNSTLESIVHGVAMIAWPLYAEQRLNKLYLVEEVKLAVAVEEDEKGLVAAEEVEKKVRWVMQTEGGREVKARMREAKDKAAEAWKEGGSSYAAWLEVVRVLKGYLPLYRTGVQSRTEK